MPRFTDDGDPSSCYLPSPAEIEAACAAIRATWSFEELEKRRYGVQQRSRAAVDPAVRAEAEGWRPSWCVGGVRC
jgi:hypothetical protein